MRRPTSLLAAEAFSVDAFTGRLTAFNILDAIYASVVPARLGKLAVAVTYELTDEGVDFHERVVLKAPSGEIVMRSACQVSLVPRTENRAPLYTRSLHALWNIDLSQYGVHTLAVEHGPSAEGPWELATSIHLALFQGVLPGQPDNRVPSEKPAPSLRLSGD